MNYIANTKQQQQDMLKVCGVSSIDELFKDIPSKLRPQSFNLPHGKTELEVVAHLESLGRKNCADLVTFLGGGYYDHYIPAAIDALSSRSEFYTAYTPYQPELSQGTLQVIYEYQSHICRLTGLDFSNASLYDGGTAVYEAAMMAIGGSNKKRLIVDCGVNPIHRKILASYSANHGIEIVEIAGKNYQTNRGELFKAMNDSTAAVILQNPNFFGVIDDYSDISAKCSTLGIVSIQSTYPMALALMKSPSECGIDITIGEGQCFGIPLSFGGPYLGYIAVNKKFVRKMPGRIAGRTTDSQGRSGFVLTLQAREQHIRREKATSNICTNEALCALRAHIYLSLLGKEGLRETAQLCMDKAWYMKEQLSKIKGVKVFDAAPIFNEFVVHLPKDASEVAGAMVEKGFAAGFPVGKYYKGLENDLLIAVTEKRTKTEISHYAEALESTLCQ